MGWSIFAIPFIGEIAAVVDAGARTVAAGACAAVGQTDAANDLIQSAGQTFVDYSNTSAIAANINMAVSAAQGDYEKVERLKKSQAEAWTDLGESTPVVGHVIGVVKYAKGDKEGGDRCMINATRTTAIIAATAATGGGALAVGGAALVAGAAYDGVATGINSAAKGEYSPVGNVAAATQAVKTGDPKDIYTAVTGPLADFGAGALAGKIRTAGGGALKPPPLAGELGKLGRASEVASFETRLEVPGRPQLSYPVVQAANVIKTTRTTSAALQTLQAEATRLGKPVVYDFVRLLDGTYRFISHEDAAAVARADPSGLRVGHTSLVEEIGGGKVRPVAAAGEIYVSKEGNIMSINSLSGHFQVPLNIVREAMGPTWPAARFTNTLRPRILFGIMFDTLQLRFRVAQFTAYSAVYSSFNIASIKNAKHIVGVYVQDHVEIAYLEKEDVARQLYDHPSTPSSKAILMIDGSVINKSEGPDTPKILDYLAKPDREESLDFDNNDLMMVQFLPVLDDDDDDLAKLVPKDPIYGFQVGRVVSNDKVRLYIPARRAIRLG